MHLKKIHVSQLGFGFLAVILIVALIGMLTLGGKLLIDSGFFGGHNADEVELPGEGLVGYPVSYGCDTERNTGTVGLGEYGVIFNSSQTVELVTFALRVARVSSSPLKVWRIVIYAGPCVGYPVAAVSEPLYQDDFEQTPGFGLQPYTAFNFAGGQYLYEDVVYTAFLDQVSGPGDNTGRGMYGYDIDLYGCEEQVGRWLSGGCYYDVSYDYWITGVDQVEPEVVTVGHVVNEDGSVSILGWCEVVGSMNVGFVVSGNESAVEIGEGTVYECGVSGSGTRKAFEARLVYLLNDETYYYRAFASTGGVTYYGDVLSFVRVAGDVPVSLDCIVVENDIDGITFESSLSGVHEDVAYNVSIEYGESVEAMMGGNETIELGDLVTNDTAWRTVVGCGVSFGVGVKYYYRAWSVGNDTSVAYSETRWFVPYDPDQPSPINWLSGWLGWDIKQIWWLWVLLGLFGVWLLAGRFKQVWLGIIGTGVLMILLITFGFVSGWVVVLLAIVCGFVIFKIVFRGSTGGSGE